MYGTSRPSAKTIARPGYLARNSRASTSPIACAASLMPMGMATALSRKPSSAEDSASSFGEVTQMRSARRSGEIAPRG